MNLVVFDITGREVAKLYDGFIGTGYHEFVWDAGRLGSGVYFIRLTVDSGESMVRKVMLIK